MAGGRPTKFHPERVEAILISLRNGAPKAQASEAAGIHYDTFVEWVNTRPEFSDAVKRARAQFVTDSVSYIAAQESWQARAWLLERLEHETFGRRDRIDMAVDVKSLAAKIAADQELDADSVIAEAEAILASG